jgi:predicted MFS family arabinose efflux permease
MHGQVGSASLNRNHNFTLLWLGGAFSAVGSRASSMAFPLLVLAVGGSASDAGLVGAAAMLPHLLFQLPAGALVDRWNRRTVLIATDVGRALAIGSVAWAALVSDPLLAHLAVAAFVEGTLTVFHVLAQRAAVRTVVPDHHLRSALSRNEVTMRAAFLGGQPLGGLLFAMGRWVPFLADLVTYLISLCTVVLLRGEFRVRHDDPAATTATQRGPRTRGARGTRRGAGSATLWGEVWQGWLWLWRHPFLRAVALSIAASNMLLHATYLTVIVTITERGGSSVLVGFVLAGTGVGGVLGAFTAPLIARRLSLPTIFIGVNWTWALVIVPVALLDRPWVSAAGLAVFAVAGATCNVVVGAYQIRVTPPHLMARVSAVIGTVSWGTIPLGTLLAGLMLDHMGGTEPLALLGVVLFVMAIAVTLSRGVRQVPDDGEAEESRGLGESAHPEPADPEPGGLEPAEPGGVDEPGGSGGCDERERPAVPTAATRRRPVGPGTNRVR